MEQDTERPEITVAERIFYAVIFLAALFVAVVGYVLPERLDAAFTWADLPPLHANFVATLYLFGAVYLGPAVFARRARPFRPALGGIAVFTGVLLLVTLRNLDAFDFSLGPVWIWTLSYLIYPPIAIVLLLLRRGRPAPSPTGATAPPWVRLVLIAHAAVFGLVGVLMFALPDVMVSAWPWPVTPIVIEAYSSPFLTIAFCAGAYASSRTWPDVRPLLPALLVVHVATLVVSLLHRELFSTSAISTWVWFVGFALGAMLSAAALIATTPARSSPRSMAAAPDLH